MMKSFVGFTQLYNHLSRKLVLICFLFTPGLSSAGALDQFILSDSGLRLIAEDLQLTQNHHDEISWTLVRKTSEYEDYALKLKRKFKGLMSQLDVGTGPLRLLIRKPTPAFPRGGQSFPVVFVTAGLVPAKDILEKIKIPEPAVIAIFDYQISSEASEAEAFRRLVSNLPKIQLQMATAMTWLASQNFANSDRINFIHISLGSFLSPLSQRLAQLAGLSPYSTIFAFGGAGTNDLLMQGLIRPELQRNRWLTPGEVAQIEGLLNPVLNFIDPKHHLPRLSGRFLTIHGSRDEVIPPSSQNALQAALPPKATKESINIDTRHINLSRDSVIDQTMQLITDWYLEIGALR